MGIDTHPSLKQTPWQIPVVATLGAGVLPVLSLLIPSGWGLAGVCLGLLAGLLGTRRHLPAVCRAMVVGLSGSLVALTAMRLFGWWHCETGCQGGGYYHRLGAVDTLALALVAYVVLFLLVLRDARCGAWNMATTAFAWLLLGVSVFFLEITWQLGISCRHCLTTHATVAVIALGLLAPPARNLRWWQPPACLLFGFLLTNTAFHHRAVPDGTRIDAQMTVANSDTMIVQTIDAHRSVGNPHAPISLSVVIDLRCAHCAEMYPTLWRAITELAGERLYASVLILARTSDAAASDLARAALAAAAVDAQSFQQFMLVALGSREGSTYADLRSRLAEIIDVAQVDAHITSDSAAIAVLSAADGQRLRTLKTTGATPIVVAQDRASGKTLGRWQGTFATSEVIDAIRRLRDAR